MSNQTSSSLKISVEYEKPIELKALGKAFCALSDEFSQFIEKRDECKDLKATLFVQEIKKGSMIINLIPEIVNNVNIVINIDISVLLLCFITMIRENPFSKYMRKFIGCFGHADGKITFEVNGKEHPHICARDVMSKTGKLPCPIKKVKLLKFKQVKDGYKGVIKEFSDKSKKVTFNGSEQNISRTGFLVDVEVEFFKGEPIAYEVIKVY